MSLNLKRWATALTLATGLVGLTQVARADLLGYWDFNNINASEQAEALDQSGNANHGEILGGVKYTDDKGGASGKAGDRGLVFNGGNSVAIRSAGLFGAFDSIGEKNALTVSFWQYGADTNPRDHSDFWAEPNRSFQAHVPWSNSNVYFDTGGCCNADTRINGVVDAANFKGQWNQWVFVKDGDNKYIYVNGAELYSDAAGASTAPLVAPTGLWLGSGADGGAGADGIYDDFAIWDEGLTADQVDTLYNKGVRALEPGLPTVTSDNTSLVKTGRLALGAGNKLVGAAYLADPTTGEVAAGKAPVWTVNRLYDVQLKPEGADYTPGLQTEWFNGKVWSSSALWTANSPAPGQYIGIGNAPTFPAFSSATISTGSGKLDSAGEPAGEYPAATGWTGNHENFSNRFSGQIFVPAGTVNFRDHNDDYAYLAVDGQVLIDDNTWTSFDGQGDTANPGTNTGGTGSMSFTKTDETYKGVQGHWYSIDFRGAEGGGGDNFRLLWDYSGKNQDNADGASVEFPEFNTIDEDFFRSKSLGIKVTHEIPLGAANTGAAVGVAGNSAKGTKTTDADLGYFLAPGETQTLRMYVSDPNGLIQTAKMYEATLTGPPVGTSGLPGDIDGNGKVDLTDFGILKANFGKSAAAGAPVPEPSTFLLAGLGLLGLALRTGFRRWKR